MIAQDDVLYTHDLVIKPLEARYHMVYSPHTVKHCIVNDFGKRVVQACSGQTRQQVAQTLGLAAQRMPELFGFLDALQAAGIVSTQAAPSQPLADTLCSPDEFVLQSVSLALTESCNLQCLHCFLPDQSRARAGELDLEQMLAAIDAFARLGEHPNYTLTGGEVMLRPRKLWGIIEYLRENDLADNILVLTNGTLVTQEDVEAFARHGVAVQVSLDGSKAAVHDQIRNAPAFERTTRAIRMLVERGVYASICITVMQPNLHDLENIVRLALDMNVPKIQFQPLCLSGSARAHAAQLELTPEKAFDIMSSVKKLAEGKDAWGFEPCSHYSVYDGRRLRPCDMGAYLYMASDGELYPCAGLMHPAMLLGNVAQGFSLERWQTHPTLLKLRSLTVNDFGDCAVCDVKYICGGGCRGDALEMSGDLLGANPFCYMERRAIWEKLHQEALHTLHTQRPPAVETSD